ncbi:MAG: lipid-A-disaccharide synthase [Candidatus Hydrogenedentes bacterium]|nr:lipid-A-disaccharide synthase [Candidatus Hydrogenedentota bacterium]
MSRVFFSAGETSGDIHGANLIRAIRAADPAIECVGYGGTRMAEAGMELRYDLASRAIMGFAEVVRHLGFFRNLYRATVESFEYERPDCLVVIDYPGFNMQIMKRAALLGIPVVWYISPQVWAWKKGRIYVIARNAQKVLVILPFEERIYQHLGVDCTYVGHPLLDQIDRTALRGTFAGGTVIALMPGSRAQEIERHLAVMLEVARGIRVKYPDARFIIPCVDAEREAQVRALAGEFPIETTIGNTYELLSVARFCLVASGTATVETTLFDVPMIVMYKVAPLTYLLARLLVKVPHFGMVNLLAGKRIVPEYLQHEATTERMLPEALALIAEGSRRDQMLADLRAVRDALGGPGASARAAEAILGVMRGGAHA